MHFLGGAPYAPISIIPIHSSHFNPSSSHPSRCFIQHASIILHAPIHPSSIHPSRCLIRLVPRTRTTTHTTHTVQPASTMYTCTHYQYDVQLQVPNLLAFLQRAGCISPTHVTRDPGRPPCPVCTSPEACARLPFSTAQMLVLAPARIFPRCQNYVRT